MDKFDQSTYQDAFSVKGDLNVDHPIVKLLTDPSTPVDVAKQHFDNLNKISTGLNPSGLLEAGNASKNLHTHFLHPTTPWKYPDEGNGSFIDHVVDSAVNSENRGVFHDGIISQYLKPRHLEKVINSEFLNLIPSWYSLPTNDGYSKSAFDNIIEKVSRENTSDHTRKILIDKILNSRYQTHLPDNSIDHWKKIYHISRLVPVMSNENMHHVLDHGILDESNIKDHSDHSFRFNALDNLASFGDDSVRDKLLEKHPLLDQNENGTLGNQTNIRSNPPNPAYYQNNYIQSMMKYGNNEQKNKMLMQIKNKNYKRDKNPDITNVGHMFFNLNNEQRHYVIANFHPSDFDPNTFHGSTISTYGTNDQKHHFVQRHNDLNIKIPSQSYLRRYPVHLATQALLDENDKIKES